MFIKLNYNYNLAILILCKFVQAFFFRVINNEFKDGGTVGNGGRKLEAEGMHSQPVDCGGNTTCVRFEVM